MNIIYKRLILLTIYLFSVLCAVSNLSAQESYPYKTDRELSKQPDSNFSKRLELDKGFLVGKLSSGMTYYIKHSANPAKCADFYIVNNVGSVQEDSTQLGLAHFLEHMAFSDLEHFPGKMMLEYFASIGVKFGYNVNAYTSADRTVYNISDVPVIRNSILDSVLLVLHDWSSFINCKPEAVDAERGIVIEEWRRGVDTRTKMFEALSSFEEKGSKFAHRKPIGDPKIIETFEYKTLIDFYNKWYRPDLQAIVIVGDIDVKDMEERVKRIMSDLPNREEFREKYPRLHYIIPDNDTLIIRRHIDTNMAGSSFRTVVTLPEPSKEQKETEDGIKENLIGNLLCEILSRRSDNLISSGKAKYMVMTPVIGDLYYTAKAIRLIASPIKEDIRSATVGVLEDYERLIRYGVCREELNDAKIKLLSSMNRFRRLKGSPVNSEYVDLAVDNFTRNTPLIDPLAKLSVTQSVLERIGVDEINKYISDNFTRNGDKTKNRNQILILTGNEKADKAFYSDNELKALMDSLKSADIEPYHYVSDSKFTINEQLEAVPLKDRIKESNQFKDTKVVDLPNGMKVYWIYKSDTLSKMSLGNSMRFCSVKSGGYADFSDDQLKNVLLLDRFSGCFNIGGFSNKRVKKMVNINDINIAYNFKHNFKGVSGQFNGYDIEEFFKYLYLNYITYDIDIKEFNKKREELLKQFDKKKKDDKVFREKCNQLSYKPSILLNFELTKSDIENFTPDKLSDLKKSIVNDCSDMSFVFTTSSIKLNDVLPYIEKYMTNLPCKTGKAKLYERYQYPNTKSEDLVYEYTETSANKASVTIEMQANLKNTKENFYAARLFRYILSERYYQSIREERSGTYYVAVDDEFVTKPYNHYKLVVSFDTNPSMVDELVQCVWDGIEQLAKYGPTEKEMNEIKLYLPKQITANSNNLAKNIAFALSEIKSYLMGSAYFIMDEIGYVNAIEAKDIQKIAKQLVKQRSHHTFVYKPKESK